ncbi:MAG TPA: histidine phosphatase family protein [Noviherbaspirillum sp.]
MRLYLVRHPRARIASGVCYGSTDLDVAPPDIEHAAAALTPVLPRGVPVYSSPLRRCSLLADRLAVELGSPTVQCDARLAELHFGAWEGRAWNEIPASEVDAWAADVTGYRPGGGESVLQAAARVAAFLDDVRHIAQAVVVCHAGTIRLLRALSRCSSLAQAAALAASPESIAPDYGSLTILER